MLGQNEFIDLGIAHVYALKLLGEEPGARPLLKDDEVGAALRMARLEVCGRCSKCVVTKRFFDKWGTVLNCRNPQSPHDGQEVNAIEMEGCNYFRPTDRIAIAKAIIKQNAYSRPLF
ncbi:hypothetical protein A2872_03800 [Candidatus Gottesmanbacteria bacterium RIFCSPHIGHO2_01_FULL_42_12]|uniref:Uncharacterized protein n=1 Tax=Candidatus Gottesmanbacteria bacterium RIFCSPHIGHO2_01_FULL_42_12 TaxID=1798377 RepID=A0A1F5Z4L1_9BACT|nr:MAG: hypothetical protein A2872_03800 [Candidatus Gottesmanbacteria bacterium RIFCSPHIGHO2_01_FULL_42_12]